MGLDVLIGFVVFSVQQISNFYVLSCASGRSWGTREFFLMFLIHSQIFDLYSVTNLATKGFCPPSPDNP